MQRHKRRPLGCFLLLIVAVIRRPQVGEYGRSGSEISPAWNWFSQEAGC